MKNIYLQLLDKLTVSSSLVLATVTSTSGSTPQKPGSSALFYKDGLLAGTVGGGRLEGEIQKIAQSALISKKSGHYHFRLDNDINHKEEAICGGQISILIDAKPENHIEVFKQMKQSIQQRKPGILVSLFNSLNNDSSEIQRFWITESNKHLLNDRIKNTRRDIEKLFETINQSDFREFFISPEEEKTYIFLETILPLPRLVIAGAGHIGKALAHLGNLLDFEVTVIDDRIEYANRENITDADHIVVDDIGKAMLSVEKTNDTYIAIVTRGHMDDAKALKACIGSGAAYVGMIGSVNKITLMRNKFIDEGWATPLQWDAIHAPVGLEIHSKTVQEIAVSIAAQLVLLRNLKVKTHA
jgi:xanthine dehydrogenase accessory factor